MEDKSSKSNLYLVAIVGIVAVVSIVVLAINHNNSMNYLVTDDYIAADAYGEAISHNAKTALTRACVESSMRSCYVTNGVGKQFQPCSSASDEWSVCTVSSCNAGYKKMGNACVLN